MHKKMTTFRYLCLFILLLLSIRTLAQESFTKELKWVPRDSINETILKDTTQIIGWGSRFGSSFSSYKTKNIWIRENEFFILLVDICSGIYCPSIAVFRKELDQWRLLTWTRANLNERIKIEADSINEKIIFKTRSGTIGELAVGKRNGK